MGKDKQGEMACKDIEKEMQFALDQATKFDYDICMSQFERVFDNHARKITSYATAIHFTRSSQRSKLASLLANRSDTLIMLTATPHDGKGQSVASLMNMLDPTAIADEENYTKDDIQGLLIRRFKKDIQDQVSDAFKERVITIERCAASAREEAAYDIFADMKLQMDAG